VSGHGYPLDSDSTIPEAPNGRHFFEAPDCARHGIRTPVTTPRDGLGHYETMDGRSIALVALAAAGLWQAVHAWRVRPVHPQDGILAPDEPKQAPLEHATPIAQGHWTLTPRAEYDITARILSREDYSFDSLAGLIPEDLALGWGAMSDNRILADFKISQGARFYGWRASALPIPAQEVIEHSANTHVIPADSVVRSQLARLRTGQVVHLSGVLVDAVRDDGAYIRTSLTRTDSGAGACEVMLVEHVFQITGDAQ